MKKILFILHIIIPFICLSEEVIIPSANIVSGEIILPGGDHTHINNAILALGGSGTIIIKGNININSSVTIPNGITLEILTGYKLNIGPTNPQIVIKGNIVASLNQIFNIPVNHNLKIYNQAIYPEWFGIISYQNNSLSIDDVIPLKKALKTYSEGGKILLQGSTYNLKTQIIVEYGITIEFINNAKLVIDSITNPVVEFKGIIETKPIQIFETPINHNLKIYNQPIYPEWYGKCLYQKAVYLRGYPHTYHIDGDDDEIRIQKAVNSLITGGVIKFVGEAYSIYNSVKINVISARLEGFEKTYFPAESLLNHFVATKNTQFNMFEISQPGVIFSQLGFVGYDLNYMQTYDPTISLSQTIETSGILRDYTFKGVYGIGTALSFNQIETNRADVPIKDIDAQVIGCNFLDFKYCIYAEGTNLKVVDNTIVGSYIGVYFNEANNDLKHQFTNSQMRGLVVDRNRFHSMGSYLLHDNLAGATCIKVWGTYGFSEDLPEGHEASYTTRGYFNQITNNFADDCKTFFEGTIDRSKISNNSILNSGDTAIKIKFGLYGQITNNIIDGSWTWNPHQNFQGTAQNNPNAFPTGSGIQIEYANHLMIHDNKINNKRFHGIHIVRSKNSSIQNNFITNFNRFSLVRENGNYVINDMEEDAEGKYTDPLSGRKYNGIYDGIRIDYTEIVPNSFPPHRYNIQNIVANNVITQNHLKSFGRYGIYIGDGDAEGFVKNNFIKSHGRLVQELKIENP